jgi:prevent-host-death family protein
VETIGERRLRNDTAELMRRVEAGESFVVTRNGRPIADLVPHGGAPARRRLTLAEAQRRMGALPPIDVERWHRDREADDALFGAERTDAAGPFTARP